MADGPILLREDRRPEGDLPSTQSKLADYPMLSLRLFLYRLEEHSNRWTVMETDVQCVARALGYPTRHRLFRYIVDAPGPVGVAELTDYVRL